MVRYIHWAVSDYRHVGPLGVSLPGTQHEARTFALISPFTARWKGEEGDDHLVKILSPQSDSGPSRHFARLSYSKVELCMSVLGQCVCPFAPGISPVVLSLEDT
jgi:hypothetical protein